MSPYVKLSNIQIHPSYLFGPITIFGPCVFNPKLILRFRDLKRFDRFLSGFVYFRVLLRTIYNIWFLFWMNWWLNNQKLNILSILPVGYFRDSFPFCWKISCYRINLSSLSQFWRQIEFWSLSWANCSICCRTKWTNCDMERTQSSAVPNKTLYRYISPDWTWTWPQKL